MTLLLDTQVVIWILEESERLPRSVRDRIASGDDAVVLSVIVLWEVAIKSGLGKLKVAADFRARAESFDFVPLPVTGDHAWAVRELPLHHRDPFDRLLIAQAQIEGATIVSADPRFGVYDVPVLWE